MTPYPMMNVPLMKLKDGGIIPIGNTLSKQRLLEMTDKDRAQQHLGRKAK